MILRKPANRDVDGVRCLKSRGPLHSCADSQGDTPPPPLPRSRPRMSTSSSPPKPPRPVPKVDEAIRAETELNGSERILVGSVWARPPLAHYFPREKPRL